MSSLIITNVSSTKRFQNFSVMTAKTTLSSLCSTNLESRYRGTHWCTLDLLIEAAVELEEVGKAVIEQVDRCSGGKARSKSTKVCSIFSSASTNEVLVKSETTLKDTIHSSGAMLMCLIHSWNLIELEMLCSESAINGLREVTIHFNKLYRGKPASF